MCTRYILLPENDTKVEKIIHDESGYLFADEEAAVAFKKDLQYRFAIDDFRCPPAISFNTAPTNRGLVILNENGRLIADNFIFGFKRRWQQGGRMKYNPGTNFRFDNLLPNIPEYTDAGLPTNDRKSGNWMYWEAFSKKQYCIIPIRAFIEFDREKREVALKTKTTVKEFSVPFMTELRSQKLAGIAGLWEYAEDEQQYRFTFGTTDPNDLVRIFHHDRFPVFLLEDSAIRLWLDPEVSVEEKIRLGLTPARSDLFQSWRINDKINNARNKGPEVIDKAGGEVIQVA